jgi:hypothetical protein
MRDAGKELDGDIRLEATGAGPGGGERVADGAGMGLERNSGGDTFFLASCSCCWDGTNGAAAGDLGDDSCGLRARGEVAAGCRRAAGEMGEEKSLGGVFRARGDS